jgi:CRISPR/Cas system-associated exonuclease Cas4 (RecB family)
MRYWYHPESDSYFSSKEDLSKECVEVEKEIFDETVQTVLSVMNNEELTLDLVAAIDKASIELYEEKEHRKHLGASIIGAECDRQLWYTFRWAKMPEYPGRLLRLFNRGKREEQPLMNLLDKMGFAIANNQQRVSDIDKHFGGSVDAIAELNGTVYVVEFKTSGTGRKFNELRKDGVIKAKFQHYVQMCIYGYYLDCNKGIYIAVNKNDDDIHLEVVDLDFNLANEYIKRAEVIIGSPDPLKKISEDPNYYICSTCTFKQICHNGQTPEKNCRSCKMSSACEDGQWFCGQWNNYIPADFIKQGCDQWEPNG